MLRWRLLTAKIAFNKVGEWMASVGTTCAKCAERVSQRSHYSLCISNRLKNKITLKTGVNERENIW